MSEWVGVKVSPTVGAETKGEGEERGKAPTQPPSSSGSSLQHLGGVVDGAGGGIGSVTSAPNCRQRGGRGAGLGSDGLPSRPMEEEEARQARKWWDPTPNRGYEARGEGYQWCSRLRVETTDDQRRRYTEERRAAVRAGREPEGEMSLAPNRLWDGVRSKDPPQPLNLEPHVP